MLDWSDVQKLDNSKRLSYEQFKYYQLFCNMFLICMERRLRLIVENPYNSQSYLNMHFPILPVVIDKDRRILGDKFKKPTQYWFINILPKNNKIKYGEFKFGYHEKLKNQTVRDVHGIDRSLINEGYVEQFCKKYIF